MPIAVGTSGVSRSINSCNPFGLRATTKHSPDGRKATSSRSLETSIPTTMVSILSRPCASGLRWRPKRLFGFDGTTGEDPCSPTGSFSLREVGLPPATASPTLHHDGDLKLQGRRGFLPPLPLRERAGVRGGQRYALAASPLHGPRSKSGNKILLRHHHHCQHWQQLHRGSSEQHAPVAHLHRS